MENEFIKNAEIYEDKHGIAKEMLKVFKIYKNHVYILLYQYQYKLFLSCSPPYNNFALLFATSIFTL